MNPKKAKAHMRIDMWQAAGLCMVLAGAPAVGGVEMYAIDVLADPDRLIRFDASDPADFTTIGPTGVEGISFGGLEFDASGDLWAYATIFDSTGGAASGLYRLDPLTGEAKPVGSSSQTLQDLSFNPLDGKLYGINTQQASISKLYEVDRVTGDVDAVMEFSGLPETHFLNGLAIDANGDIIVHDVVNDQFYKSAEDGVFSLLFDLPQDTNFSQGMTIDWSGDGTGYHGAVGFGDFPDFFSQINTFETDGSAYLLGESFGPNDDDGIPPVQPGDIAILPVPAPGVASLAVIFCAVGAARRRRRTPRLA